MKRILPLVLALLLCFAACAERQRLGSACVVLRCDDAQASNARMAAMSLNDTVIPPGGSFSFNGCTGPRNEGCGYTNAQDGSGSVVCGGGADMAASAVYMAVRGIGGVSVTSVSVYQSYVQGYVSSASDAVCTRYGGADLCFTNNSGTAIVLSVWISDGALYCEAYAE